MGGERATWAKKSVFTGLVGSLVVAGVSLYSVVDRHSATEKRLAAAKKELAAATQKIEKFQQFEACFSTEGALQRAIVVERSLNKELTRLVRENEAMDEKVAALRNAGKEKNNILRELGCVKSYKVPPSFDGLHYPDGRVWLKVEGGSTGPDSSVGMCSVKIDEELLALQSSDRRYFFWGQNWITPPSGFQTQKRKELSPGMHKIKLSCRPGYTSVRIENTRGKVLDREWNKGVSFEFEHEFLVRSRTDGLQVPN